MTRLLEIADVSMFFGGIGAVRNVSMSVVEGQIFSIIGPNGAGKTTLFNVISGLFTPQSGRIQLGGQPINGVRPDLLARAGLARTFQNLQIFSRMSVVENVMVGRQMHERSTVVAQLTGWPSVRRENESSRAKSLALLEFVGLSKYADKRSAGMPYGALKRLEIARAMAIEPRILLLDEPAAGCNPVETEEIEQLIRNIAKSGVTVMLVEHDMKLVMRVSDRIHVMDGGVTICEGTAREVQSDSRVIGAYLGDHGTKAAANA